MEQLTEKGQELVTFKQKYGIKLVDDRDSDPSATAAKSGDTGAASKTTTSASQGVLVSK